MVAANTGTAATAAPPSKEWGIPRVAIVLLVLAAMVIAAVGLNVSAAIVAPAFLGINLVVATSPVIPLLAKRGIPRPVGALVVLVIIFVVVLGLAAVLTLAVAQFAASIPAYQQRIVGMGEGIIKFLSTFGVGQQQIEDVIGRFKPEALLPAAQPLLSALVNVTSLVIFMLTVLVFLAMDLMDVPRRMKLINLVKPSLTDDLNRFFTGVRKYWLVTGVFGFIAAALDTVIMFILGVPLAPLWGLLLFITNFIPLVGLFIGLVPPALLTLLSAGDYGPRNTLLLIGGCLLVMIVVQTIIQPRFSGDAVGVTATVAFLALAMWTLVLGPLGALLALPATLFVKSMLIDADPRARWINAIISSRPERDALPEQPSSETAHT